MDLRSLKKLAVVSAVALSTALYSGGAFAASVQSGQPNTVNVTGTVQNTITVTTTPLDFGTIAAESKSGSTATGVLTPGAVTLTGTPGTGPGTAKVIPDTGNPPSSADIVLTGFTSTQLNVDYGTVVNMTNGTDTLYIGQLKDNLTTPDQGTGVQQGIWNAAAPYGSGAAAVQGQGTTDATSGNLEFHVGGTLVTSNTVTGVLSNGAYTGSFDITVSY